MKAFIIFITACISIPIYAQKKIIDHPDFDLWNRIRNKSISPDGNMIMYALEKGEKDHFLKIKDGKSKTIFEYKRAEHGRFTDDSKYALFTIKAWKDSVSEMKRRKVKKRDMPKDTLGIYDIKMDALTKIAHVKSYKIPQKWSGYVAYHLEELNAKGEKKEDKEDTAEKEKKKSAKKTNEENGYHLVLRNLQTKAQDTFTYVTHFSFAEKGRRLAFSTTGEDGKRKAGVYVLNLDNQELRQIYEAPKAKYYQLSFNETGKNLGFIVDNDTTKVQIRPYALYLWKENQEIAEKLVDPLSAPKNYMVSADGRLSFSKDGSKLYFGLSTPPIVKDTTLLDDEIVNVEVWTYDEPRLYTVQELQLARDKKKSYPAVIHLDDNNTLVQIATEAYPEAQIGNEGNAVHALVSNSLPYQLEQQWKGRSAYDLAVVNVTTGERKKVISKIPAFARLSPKGKYIYGYHAVDSTWFTYHISSEKCIPLTKGKLFYDEINDMPNHPFAYGIAGWTKDDKRILIYDRYDIWEFNPDTGDAIRLTQGREKETEYRYIRLDDEERFMDVDKKWLLMTFNERTKHSGYAEFHPKSKKIKQLISGPHRYSAPKKAKTKDKVIFSRESFQEFPDIRYSDLSFKKQKVISLANPQQKNYNWGTIELVSWTSLDGKTLTGMLVKPEDFDPEKKYPMIVNFYEKSSDRLHVHRAPYPGRSTINYSFYASRGYLIFNPDVYYRVGYPGESAFNCVIPGITSLIEKGFVDKDNIGVQGHSWGGYQIAYLVTKTNIFKAAESGAPVVNMISAYGGIRWGSGLSRQFQYEHTQSRIGGSPWEYPNRYIENSPIFNIDKINTPLLIMHNDNDGHVPWYQGIEFFVSLRRLQKPSWFLNYNKEPHWPLKLHNRKDFNIRMAQFFDHYLQGKPKPVWMERGVPAIEKGIHQGYELEHKSN